MRSSLTLVLGGARSGKSALAERLACSRAGSRIYLATAQAHDDEMDRRIAAHRLAREPGNWRTIEEPLHAADHIAAAPEGTAILLDCATLWLSNHLLAGSDITAETERLLQGFKASASHIVVVSNETGLGIVPENALARRFRDEQGRLNQRIAAEADTVIAVMAGLPMVLKGTLPESL